MRPFAFIPGRRARRTPGDQPARSGATLLPWLAGFVVFTFRATSLRDLTNDHYMHLSWAQQVLLGDLPGRDFVDPGMPAAWGVSAIVQAVWPGPFSEALLSAAMFGAAAGVTTWIVLRLTGSWLAALGAAALTAAFVPRLYNYPKLLAPAVTMALLQRYVELPTFGRASAIGVSLAAAALFRHDLGLYATALATVGLAVAHRDSPRAALRALLVTAGATALAMAPYLLYVQWSEGLWEHLRRGMEFSGSESHQLQYPWPRFPSLAPGGGTWGHEDATAFLYYGSWLLPLLALPCLRGLGRPGPADRLPLAAAALTCLAVYMPVIVRHPVDQRLPDVAVPLAVVGLFAAHRASRAAFHAASNPAWTASPRLVARAGGLGVVLLAAASLVNAGIVGGFARELEDTRIERGPAGLLSKIRSLRQDTRVWPWEPFWPHSGDFPAAVRYLRACTRPDDYVLLTWASSEYFYFAQRKFASGFTMFLPPDGFTTDQDQDFMLARLERERPPIALVNQTGRGEFRTAYPRVDAWIAERYTLTSGYTHYNGDEIAIGVRADLRPTSTFGAASWPCPRSGSASGGP